MFFRQKIERVVISSILPLPSVYCLFRGSADDIVGIHPSSMAAAENSYLINVFPEIANADTSFVENGEVNIEQLLALKPDVVFYSANNTDEREMYDNAGIPAVGFSTSMSDYDCVETYADWIQLLGDIYGEQDTANEIIAEGRSVAEEIKSVTSTIADAGQAEGSDPLQLCRRRHQNLRFQLLRPVLDRDRRRHQRGSRLKRHPGDQHGAGLRVGSGYHLHHELLRRISPTISTTTPSTETTGAT